MALAPWRSILARALHRNRSLVYARYLQLATVHPTGRPANRTVVFRGFLDQTNQLQFVTDSRSAKAEEIERSPWGEICWYFPNTREQFRISGLLTLVQETEPDATLKAARQQAWQSLSDAARAQFSWPYPGHPRAESGFDDPVPNQLVPLANFYLLLFQPDRVDHLELRGNPQNRWIYECNHAEWTSQEVNP